MTESGRPVKYFPVRPLNGPEQFRDNPWMKYESVKRMVDEIGGHPRGLRLLREFLEKRTRIARTLKAPQFDELFDILARESLSLSSSLETSPQLISACLLGLDVPRLRQPNPSVTHTYAYYITQVQAFASQLNVPI